MLLTLHEAAERLTVGDAAGEVRADPRRWASHFDSRIHWIAGLGTAGPAEQNYGRGYADGGAFENRETARRTRTAIGAALFIGAALGAVLLAIAQGLLRG